MRDPVNDFEIPEEWIEKSPLPRAEVEDLVTRGLVVVLSDGSFLKRGFTTGTTAAAAAKAAVLSLGKDSGAKAIGAAVADPVANPVAGTVITVPTPIGLRAELKVEFAKDGDAGVRKVYNDHESDITRNVLFCAKVQKTNLNDPEFAAGNAVDNILITGGIGVGIIRRAGFETRVGEYAINPKPLAQIRESVKEGLREVGLYDEICVKKESALIVSIYIPDGVELSKKTLNERIGIVGGISVLGTTGFVEPWNDHLGEMKDVLIQDAKRLVLTTGRQGMATSSMLFPGYEIVMVGSRISEGIDAAVSAEEIVVCGLPGLVLKWGNPDMLKDSGFATVVEVIEKDPTNPLLKQAFEMCIKKGKGARIVVIDREGLVLMDSKGEFDYLMKN
ncbi:Cobalt-precorrin-5B C(1)-methyltransferase [Methanimicrococcus hongohii]|uniref:Cobalt-precorrin-5B C(1)-methyltransferase n=1 Tax=Methanimicrococcus hongohii TaxID=3028295 RepID=A0AA96UYU6_9EURY|nr:cobalt-precorrin-5B (C(1))-methyltransferase [Methanimicrococcus sp. Hf6]WNY23169.1 Cobalt-precorrin-5B C(1)-methyltransferase [Methanimicrococcus sp. Hf6]